LPHHRFPSSPVFHLRSDNHNHSCNYKSVTKFHIPNPFQIQTPNSFIIQFQSLILKSLTKLLILWQVTNLLVRSLVVQSSLFSSQVRWSLVEQSIDFIWASHLYRSSQILCRDLFVLRPLICHSQSSSFYVLLSSW
jgi:hypothetical protein